MPVEKLFPEPSFTTAELFELAVTIHKPVMQKYLRTLACTAIKDICHGQRKEGESAESYLERQAVVAGGLAVVEQLLNVEPPVANDGNS